MAVVVDASVALKWVLTEPDTARAAALIGSEQLLAPDFLLLECANVLARDVKRGLIEAGAATEAYAGLTAVPLRLVPLSGLVRQSQVLAIELGRSAYDCLYLALAIAESATLVTADRRFADAVAAKPAYAGRVELL